MRWSRSGVSNYLALRSIDADAGRMVVDTTKASMVPTGDGDAVSPGDTAVSKQFTVRQLRDIISLPAEQQLSLVNDLGDLGNTQGETSEIMRWSREGAKNYATLRNIAAEAWQIVVGTTKSAIVPSVENGDVPGFGTVVPFTEGLLRSLTPLTSEQQPWRQEPGWLGQNAS